MSDRATSMCPDVIRDNALWKASVKYDQGVEEHGGRLGDADMSVYEVSLENQKEIIDQLFYSEAQLKKLEAAGTILLNGIQGEGETQKHRALVEAYRIVMG